MNSQHEPITDMREKRVPRSRIHPFFGDRRNEQGEDAVSQRTLRGAEGNGVLARDPAHG